MMRDVNRLKVIYNAMCEYHEQIPDIRMMQLINDFLAWHISEYGTDGFYIEDDECAKRFRKFMRKVMKVNVK